SPDSFFPHPDVNHIRIGIGHRNRANRAGLEKAVRDILPTGSRVGGFPYSAAGCAKIINIWLRRHPGYGTHPTTAKGSDQAILKILERVIFFWCRRRTLPV